MKEFNITDPSCLKKILKPLEAKYDILAGLIGVDCSQFEKHSGNSDKCLFEVIRVWFDMEKEKAPSREVLVQALRDIGKRKLAKDLDEKYKGNYSPSVIKLRPFPHHFLYHCLYIITSDLEFPYEKGTR